MTEAEEENLFYHVKYSSLHWKGGQ